MGRVSMGCTEWRLLRGRQIDRRVLGAIVFVVVLYVYTLGLLSRVVRFKDVIERRNQGDAKGRKLVRQDDGPTGQVDNGYE
jgi:hypothetical protein